MKLVIGGMNVFFRISTSKLLWLLCFSTDINNQGVDM
jgi:hypothetical protein